MSSLLDQIAAIPCEGSSGYLGHEIAQKVLDVIAYNSGAKVDRPVESVDPVIEVYPSVRPPNPKPTWRRRK